MNDELRYELEKLFKSYAVGVSAGMSATKPKTVDDANEHLEAVISLAEAYISKRERQARIDELNKIDEAQQDDDKWGQFSMSDSSDFSNYITQRKSKLNIGDK